jgi:hypothetical protein
VSRHLFPNLVIIVTKVFQQVTWLIIGSVISFWICFISVVMFLSPEVAGDIAGWLTANFLIMLSIIGVSICQILVFNPRAISSTSTSSHNKNNSSKRSDKKGESDASPA